MCIRRAVAARAAKEEIEEATAVATFVAAGSQIGWTNVYGESIYNRIFEKDKDEEGSGCCCDE